MNGEITLGDVLAVADKALTAIREGARRRPDVARLTGVALKALKPEIDGLELDPRLKEGARLVIEAVQRELGGGQR